MHRWHAGRDRVCGGIRLAGSWEDSGRAIVTWVKSTHSWTQFPLKSMGEVHPHCVKKTAAISGRNIVGKRLRALRLAASPKVTLEDLAGRLAAKGVQLDRSAIGRIENLDRYVLDYELKALAAALRVEVADLLVS